VQATTEGDGYSALALNLSTYARARKVAEGHARKRGYEPCNKCLTWHAPIVCFECRAPMTARPEPCPFCGDLLCVVCCLADDCRGLDALAEHCERAAAERKVQP